MNIASCLTPCKNTQSQYFVSYEDRLILDIVQCYCTGGVHPRQCCSCIEWRLQRYGEWKVRSFDWGINCEFRESTHWDWFRMSCAPDIIVCSQISAYITHYLVLVMIWFYCRMFLMQRDRDQSLKRFYTTHLWTYFFYFDLRIIFLSTSFFWNFNFNTFNTSQFTGLTYIKLNRSIHYLQYTISNNSMYILLFCSCNTEFSLRTISIYAAFSIS